MNNFAINTNAANLVSINKPEVKSNSQNSGADFIQVASESFKNLSTAQTLFVPQSNNGAVSNFRKEKLEIEKGLPNFEECIEDEVEKLMLKIEAFLKDQKENRWSHASFLPVIPIIQVDGEPGPKEIKKKRGWTKMSFDSMATQLDATQQQMESQASNLDIDASAGKTFTTMLTTQQLANQSTTISGVGQKIEDQITKQVSQGTSR